MQSTIDEELIPLIRKGSHAAFSELYNRYKAILIKHAFKKLGVFEEAKEIVQDVFSALWINHHNIPELKNVAGWLYILVRNRILKHIDHENVIQRYQVSFRDFIEIGNYYTDMQVRERELKILINHEIEQLAPKMREVFKLSRQEHLSNRNISEKLGISENTVKNHLKAAVKKLRKRLGSFFILYM